MNEERTDFEEKGRQHTQGAPAGGRPTRGPAVHDVDDTEPQGPVPPYEGRNKQADTTDHPVPPQAGDEDLKGAGGLRRTDKQAEPQPSSLDPSGGVSPGDFQPASEYTGQRSDDEGVPPPAKTSGVSQGERRAMGKSEEELKRTRDEPGIYPGEPIDEEMPNMGPADQGS